MFHQQKAIQVRTRVASLPFNMNADKWDCFLKER